jgi:hypothetical protein
MEYLHRQIPAHSVARAKLYRRSHNTRNVIEWGYIPPSFHASRIWFCSLLVDEDEQIKVPNGTEILHDVSIAYRDQGVVRSNALVLAAEYRMPGVFVTVRDQH